MRKLSALVVDDERLARQRLQRLLLQEPDVEVIGQCKSVQQARELLERGVPDVIFVDVQMPRASGLDLVRSLDPARAAIIFVTAYEQYAVDAFDVRACDYLLKPVAHARLKLALERAREALARRPDASADERPSASPPATSDAPDAILVRTEGKVLRVRIESIDWIEAAGNYVLLHVGEQTHLLRETIAAFEAKLPADRFARVHRTAIANLDRVVEFEPTLSGDFLVILRGGAQLRMSRSYRGRIRDLFGNSI